MSGVLFYSHLMTETNSFSNIPTSYESFEVGGIRTGRDVLFDGDALRAEINPIAEFAASRGFDLVGGLSATAAPSAPVQQTAYERLRNEILTRLAQAGQVRCVVLNLHGAMVSTECEDCEGDLLSCIRSQVGDGVPIGAVLDPHAHLTPGMVEAADFLIFMKEYPHTDGVERMVELLDLTGKLLDGEIDPVAHVEDCQLLGFFPTDRGPMRGFVDELSAVEREPNVLTASFVHGFPWGDTSETGVKMLIYTDQDQTLAKRVATDLKHNLWSIVDMVRPELISIEAAIAACRSGGEKPVILADIADNPGGGAPSDSTFILCAMLETGVQNAALGLLHDPVAVAYCHKVGEGGALNLRIGGKLGAFSGPPIDVEAQVLGVRQNQSMQVFQRVSFFMGDTAWIRVKGVDVVLSSQRLQMYAPDGFRHIGIEPAEYDVLVVKSSNHFRAFFSDIAGDIFDVATPGAISFDYAALPYKALKKPRHPLQRIDGLSDQVGGAHVGA